MTVSPFLFWKKSYRFLVSWQNQGTLWLKRKQSHVRQRGASAAPHRQDRWADCIDGGRVAPLLDTALTRAGHKSSGAPFRGWVGACVGGWADKTKPKKLLAAGKNGPWGCLSWLGVRALACFFFFCPVCVFVGVLVSRRFHLPPWRCHRCLCKLNWHREEEVAMDTHSSHSSFRWVLVF